VLAEHCRVVGRDPATIRRSLMVPAITGRMEAEVAARRQRARTTFPRVPEDAAGWRAAGFLHGVVAQVREDLARWEAAGVGRVMLQMLDMDDLDAIRLIGQECL
jgi:alkanesulfonate monooxygenase SsuD/methylene tetrahydromethanopterin reductase-like flavin-dependent oxidoreductase (luciferase family)